jgi:hypothetical protein
VGARVGREDCGAPEGSWLGALLGLLLLGALLGRLLLGALLGSLLLGAAEGFEECGAAEGAALGLADGPRVVGGVGAAEGVREGDQLGAEELGAREGEPVGESEGREVLPESTVQSPPSWGKRQTAQVSTPSKGARSLFRISGKVCSNEQTRSRAWRCGSSCRRQRRGGLAGAARRG